MVSRCIVLVLYFIQGSLGNAVPQPIELRISGGDTVDIKYVPFMASVHVGGSYCGGSIISRQFVLTAAHCMKKENRTSIDYVRVGSSKRSKGGQKYPIAKYIAHVKYSESNRNKRNYDLGLLKLSRSLTFGTKVAAIELASSNLNIYPGMKAHMSGWGQTAPDVRTQILHDASVTIASLSTCMNYYNNKRLTNKNICAYDVGVGACSGDSGGPLVVGGRQIGVYSAGKNKHCGHAPGIYVNVAAHSDWINYHLIKER